MRVPGAEVIDSSLRGAGVIHRLRGSGVFHRSAIWWVTTAMGRLHDGAMSSRIVLVDPFECPTLTELADLSGVPWVRVRAWPFVLSADDRVVSSIPVPAGARARAMGVLTEHAPPALEDEAWPDLTLELGSSRAEILAHMSGADAPERTRVGVVGLRGGLGVTHLAACMARTFALHPLAVALVSDDPFSPLPEWTKTPDAWPQIDVDGPLLPNRLAALVPSWRRVRIVAGRCPEVGAARAVAATLARGHDIVVEDRGRMVGPEISAGLDALVAVFSGERSDLGLWDRLGDDLMAPVIPVVRAHNTGAPCAPRDVADFLGRGVLPLHHEKGARMAPTHGGEPGDFTRGSSMKTAGEIVGRVLELR